MHHKQLQQSVTEKAFMDLKAEINLIYDVIVDFLVFSCIQYLWSTARLSPPSSLPFPFLSLHSLTSCRPPFSSAPFLDLERSLFFYCHSHFHFLCPFHLSPQFPTLKPSLSFLFLFFYFFLSFPFIPLPIVYLLSFLALFVSIHVPPLLLPSRLASPSPLLSDPYAWVTSSRESFIKTSSFCRCL